MPAGGFLLRTDMDAQPIREETGLDYASEVTAANRERKRVAVVHACRHDMRVAWLMGASALFQPGKETAEGRINELPVDHSPLFAPVIHPTLQTGIEAMAVGALAWLAK